MSGEIRLSVTTVNAPDALALAEFYAKLTGGVTKGSEHWATVAGPNGFIAFQQVDDFRPPVWPGIDVSMQMHLDFFVDDLEATGARAVAAGATQLPAELRPLLGVRRPGRPSLLPVHLGRAPPGRRAQRVGGDSTRAHHTMIGTRTGQRRKRAAAEESCAGPSPGRGSTHAYRAEDVRRRRNDASRDKGHAMAQYLISFPSNAMDQIPEEEMPDVARAAHAVCQEGINAGVYVLAGGLEDQPASIVATDGTVTDGAKPDVISGITIVDVPSRQEALNGLPRSLRRAAVHRRSERSIRPQLDAMLGEAARRR